MEEPDPIPWFNDQTYINTLDPPSMRRFIEVTYERYKEVVGEDFGTLIPTMFTDEPQFTQKKRLGFAKESKKPPRNRRLFVNGKPSERPFRHSFPYREYRGRPLLFR